MIGDAPEKCIDKRCMNKRIYLVYVRCKIFRAGQDPQSVVVPIIIMTTKTFQCTWLLKVPVSSTASTNMMAECKNNLK
jgi:hypothetical protein